VLFLGSHRAADLRSRLSLTGSPTVITEGKKHESKRI